MTLPTASAGRSSFVGQRSRTGGFSRRRMLKGLLAAGAGAIAAPYVITSSALGQAGRELPRSLRDAVTRSREHGVDGLGIEPSFSGLA